MAIEAMVAVFKESKSSSNDRLVLLALANQAGARGELSAYPRSQSYIARLANCSPSTVGRSLDHLAEIGELEVVRSGLGHAQSNYLIHLASLCEERQCGCGGEGVWSTVTTPPETGPDPSDYSRLTTLSSQRRVDRHSVLPSLPSSSADASPTAADALQGQGQPPPPADPPPEGPFQIVRPNGTIMSAEEFALMPKWAQDAARSEFGIKTAPVVAASPPDVSGGDAQSITDGDSRTRPIYRADGLARCLKRGYGFEAANKQDRTALAKLLELHPTMAQLDGAIMAMGWAKGERVDVGRLVIKWATLCQFSAKRPEAWQNPRTREKDAVEAHEAAGGSRYDRDGKIDYGV